MKKLLKFSLYSFLTIVGLFLIFFFINALDYGYKFFFNRASLTEPWQVNAAINNVGFLVFFFSVSIIFLFIKLLKKLRS